MRINKLKSYLYRLMFAGCVSVTLSGTVFASSAFNGRYYYSDFQKDYPGYRFRPIEKERVSYRGYSQQFFQNRFYPVTASRYLPVHGRFDTARYYSAYSPNYRQQKISFNGGYYQPDVAGNSYHMASALNQRTKTYDMPAFAKQYAWETAQPRGFRRGGSIDHYATQLNETVEQTSAPVYRTSPVSSQGFRYRVPSRNANYVSFADRVKPFMPVIESKSIQSGYFSRPSVPDVKTVEATNVEPVSRSGQKLVNGGNYRFRPDERFDRNAPVKPMQHEQVFPVAYKIANAELTQSGDNSLNSWSFRPSDPTF